MIQSSSLQVDGASNELLIAITKAVGGDTYMCGGGANGYQDDGLFDQVGLTVWYQNFIHPQYDQYGFTTFVQGLSVIDVLMNLGRQKSISLITGK